MLIVLVSCLKFAQAQEAPRDPFRSLVPDRPGDVPRPLPGLEHTGSEKPEPELPLPAPPPPPPRNDQLSSQIQFVLKEVRFEGNQAFSDERLSAVIQSYVGSTVANEDLFNLRDALTRFYIDHGYISSGSVIPDQKISDGVLEIRIVEGRLTDIEIAGNEWLRDSYIRERLKIGSEDVVNMQQLQNRIQLLHQDRLIERINARLSPGTESGESVLDVTVEESRPYELSFSFNNYRSPSVGELQGEVIAAHYNVTGFGDRFRARYSMTEGLKNGSASYSFPLTAYDTRLRVFYDRSGADVIEEPFNLLDIQSDIESYGASLSHPIYETPESRLSAELIFERRRSETTFQLPDVRRQPFLFSGLENGRSRLTALRFAQEWIDRSADHVIALRSTFSFGLDASRLLGADSNRINEDHYFIWLGQFQWVQRVPDTELKLVVRGDLQLTPDALLPLEKFAVGGAQSVRGYRQNELVRDQGAVASLELRYPVFRLPIPGLSQTFADGMVELAGFYDIGWSENTRQQSPSPTFISSAGLGVRWDPHSRVHSELYWGVPFTNINAGGEHSLQDSGIHFGVNFGLF